MKKNLFSIILPTYKGKFLKECIDSVLAQTYNNWELIIVNDASPEDIDSIIQCYTDPRIRYYKNKTNYGAKRLVEQWNYCLSLANGEYVICIGDDDKLLPRCLEVYDTFIQAYPKVEILHGQTDIIDENGDTISHTVERPEWESAISLLYHRTYTYHHQYIGDFCYRTDALKARGGFYPLPLAWGSDDISAIQGAEREGIANTREVVFQYRSNRLSITSSTHLYQKLKAIILDAIWKRKFLRSAHCESQQDYLYKRLLNNNLLIYTIKRCCNILSISVSKYISSYHKS